MNATRVSLHEEDDLEAAQADIDLLLSIVAMLARNVRAGFKGDGVAILVGEAKDRMDRLAARCIPTP